MINVSVNQSLLPVGARLKMTWFARLFQIIESRSRWRGVYDLSVAFVNHRTVRRLNREYRGEDKVTDVLSFATSKTFLEQDQEIGEIILAWPCVREQAKKQQKSLKEEAAMLLIHGFLHLQGFDHQNKKEKAKMFLLQDKILIDFLRK